MTTDEQRRRYAEMVAGGGPPNLVDAYADVPREAFLGPPPWLVVKLPPDPGQPYEPPSDSLDVVYRDSVIAIDPAKQLNNGQPSAHAKWLAATEARAGESALHVGCGTGYYTAILAELVGQNGRVVACEIEPALALRARRNLAPWPQATVYGDDATDPHGMHDVIYINAGITHPRTEWLDALRPGGRLVAPFTMHLPQFPHHGVGAYVVMTNAGERWPARVVTQVGIYDCATARDTAVEPQVRMLLARANAPLEVTRAPHDRAMSCLIHTAGFCLAATP